jgi:hypothetical protein
MIVILTRRVVNMTLTIDTIQRYIKGNAKAGDIKKYGLIEASARTEEVKV